MYASHSLSCATTDGAPDGARSPSPSPSPPAAFLLGCRADAVVAVVVVAASALNCEHPRPKAPRTCGCAPTSRVVWCCHLTWKRCRRVLSGDRSQLQKRRRTRTCVGSVASKGLREERASASTRVQTHACGHTHLTHRTSEPCATCRNEAKKLVTAILSRALAATAAPRPTPSRPPPGASHAFSDGSGAPPTRAFGEKSRGPCSFWKRGASPLSPQPLSLIHI